MIVIPMAGLSSRFTRAGYDRPKYMLPLTDGRSCFAHAVDSFSHYFESETFLFVARDVFDTPSFVESELVKAGVRRFDVCVLEGETRGQAETVELGLTSTHCDRSEPLTIFNIDTFRPGFRKPSRASQLDGYLEVFRGEGEGWSFVRPQPGSDLMVAETAEKRPISDLCCTGLYHFRSQADFLTALKAERLQPSMPELYVAPLYNHLIGHGKQIGFVEIDASDVIFCGTPAEYESLLAQDE